jgi:hypothetical protein
MKVKYIARYHIVLALTLFAGTVLGDSDLAAGLQLLSEGKYKSTLQDNALKRFEKAVEANPDAGRQIADELLNYSKTLASDGRYSSLLSEDASSVLKDALRFNPKILGKVIEYNLIYLQELIKNGDYSTADEYCSALKNYGATSQVFDTLATLEETFSKNKNDVELQHIYRCYKLASASDAHKSFVENLVKTRALNLLNEVDAPRSFAFSSTACSVLGSDECITAVLEGYRAQLNNSNSGGNERLKIVLLDQIKYYFNDNFSDSDERLLSESIDNLLTDYESDFAELYKNFRLILSLHYFDDLSFYFLADDFDIDGSFAVFDELKTPEETSFFYFDTSRLGSGSRGILLTDERIYFENLLGGAHAVDLVEIDTITLAYGKGISLTGWKLRINDNEDLEIRLSRIDDEALVPFVSALLFFVNLNNDLNDVSLYIPESEQKILQGSIWERHSGVIVTTAVVATVAVAYVTTQDSAAVRNAKAAVVNTLSKVANATAKKGSELAAKSKFLPKTAKYGARGLIKSRKTFEFVSQNGQQIRAKLADFYDRKAIVKMPFVGAQEGADKTARGFLRNSGYFWNEYMKKAPEMISNNNLNLIKAGKSPRVDAKWVNKFPEFKNFMGQVIEHHHLNRGGKAIPLPRDLHRGAMNYGNWH